MIGVRVQSGRGAYNLAILIQFEGAMNLRVKGIPNLVESQIDELLGLRVKGIEKLALALKEVILSMIE